MKVVIYSVSSLSAPALGVLMDEAEIYLENGHDVDFVYCDGLSQRCSINLFGSSIVCNHCRLLHRVFLSRRSKSLNVIPLSRYKNGADFVKHNWRYDTVEDIKEIKYSDIEIGYSSLSAYIDKTRNIDPIIDDLFVDFFDRLLDSAVAVVDLLENLIVTSKPDLIVSFNARLFDNNPLLTITKKRDVNYNCVELYLLDENGVRYKEYYGNKLPHNYLKWTENIYNTWADNSCAEEQKQKIGCSFFYKRRNKEYTGDVSIYIEDQQKGLKPDNVDISKFNIVIFNSSEDELAALGTEFSSKNVFINQLEGIRAILMHFKANPKYHFYLRIHPNLSKIKYSYHLDLLSLPNEFSNLTVIPGTSPVDSYSLLEMADKVVVFSSSMGVESLFWGKPVVVLGNTFYYGLKGLYKPSTPEECFEYIEQKLLPQSNYDAIKYGYYLMHKNPERTFRYVDFNSCKFYYRGRTLPCAKYQTILSSNMVFLGFNSGVILFSKIISKLKKQVIPA